MPDKTIDFNKIKDVFTDQLYARLVMQEINNPYKTIASLFTNRQDGVNATKEYIDFAKMDVVKGEMGKPLTIADFNGDLIKVDNIVHTIEDTFEITPRIPQEVVLTGFTKPKMAKAFIQKSIQFILDSLHIGFLNAELALLAGKPAKIGTDTKLITAIAFDDTIKSALANNANADAEKAGVLKTLEKIREYLTGLNTISTDHTAFGRAQKLANKGDFIYSDDGANLVFVINNGAFSKLATTTAQLFNKDDIMITIKKQVFDFKKALGLTDIENKKIIGFIFDKRAMVYARKMTSSSVFRFRKLTTLHENLFWGGYNRIRSFPITAIVNGA